VAEAAKQGRSMRALTVGGVVVSFLAGAVGLLLTLAPKLKPCLGDTNASITDAPVFPRWSYVSYLQRNGATAEQAERVGEQAGALIPISYSVSGFRDKKLGFTVSLLTVARDGTLGPVVPKKDNEVAVVFTPQDCSETGGRNLWVKRPTPHRGQPPGRYRAVIELYRDPSQRTLRIALKQTEIFRF
jgi:hypothetical protein